MDGIEVVDIVHAIQLAMGALVGTLLSFLLEVRVAIEALRIGAP